MLPSALTTFKVLSAVPRTISFEPSLSISPMAGEGSITKLPYESSIFCTFTGKPLFTWPSKPSTNNFPLPEKIIISLLPSL